MSLQQWPPDAAVPTFFPSEKLPFLGEKNGTAVAKRDCWANKKANVCRELDLTLVLARILTFQKKIASYLFACK